MDDPLNKQNGSESSSTGAQALAIIAQLHQVAIDPNQLYHQFSNQDQTFGDTEIQRAAKAIGFKSRLITCRIHNLQNTVLPAIAKTQQGE